MVLSHEMLLQGRCRCIAGRIRSAFAYSLCGIGCAALCIPRDWPAIGGSLTSVNVRRIRSRSDGCDHARSFAPPADSLTRRALSLSCLSSAHPTHTRHQVDDMVPVEGFGAQFDVDLAHAIDAVIEFAVLDNLLPACGVLFRRLPLILG